MDSFEITELSNFSTTARVGGRGGSSLTSKICIFRLVLLCRYVSRVVIQ